MTPDEIKKRVKELCDDLKAAADTVKAHNTAEANGLFRDAVTAAFVTTQTLVWFTATFVVYPTEP